MQYLHLYSCINGSLRQENELVLYSEAGNVL
jgi:hypothetical protein